MSAAALPKIFPDIEPVDEPARPFWSVMVPSYNNPELLEETLESILAQDPGPDEMQIEVVDDASSTTGIASVVESVGVGRVGLFVQPQNVGASANFTTCIRRARGEWVHILHSDDLVLPTFYERYQASIESVPEALMAAGRSIIIDGTGKQVGMTPPVEVAGGAMRDAAFSIVRTNPLRFPAVVVARRAWERLGGFHPALFHASDWEAWARVANAGPVAWVDRPLALYRTHPDSDTNRLMHRSTAYLDDCLEAVETMSAGFEPERQRAARKAGRRFVASSALYSGRLLAGEGSTRLALRHAVQHARLDIGVTSAWNSIALAGSAVAGRLTRGDGAPSRNGADPGPGGAPLVLRGHIDSPPPGAALLRKTVQFAGWALAGNGLPSAVELIIEGGVRVPAALGIDRSDVPKSLGEPKAESRCGWIADVDLGGVPLGPLRVLLEVRDGSGTSAVVSELSVSVGSHDIIGEVEVPVDGTTIDGDVIVVSGRASGGRRGFSRVEVAVDGAVVGRARLCLPPPARATDPDGRGGSLVAGFHGRFALGEGICDRDRHDVTVTAFDGDGFHGEIGHRSVSFRPWELSEGDRERAHRLRENTARVLDSAAPASPPARRKLLIFAHDLDLGGAQLYLNDLVGQMLPSLDRCTVVSARDGTLGDPLRASGVDVVITGEGQPETIDEYEGTVRMLASIVKASGCGVVLVNTFASSLAADAAVRAGAPVIWSIHESYALTDWVADQVPPRLRPYVHERLLATLAGACRLVFVAEATRQLYLGSAGVRPEAASVVHYGVDCEAIERYARAFDRHRARAEQGIDDGATVLVCPALFSERKGQSLLAEAFSGVSAEHPNASLVLVGERSISYAGAVHEAAGRNDRIRIVPMTEDAWYWYALSDVLVSAADVESMPRSILEAMAFGMPVLATSVFGVPEIVRDGVNGWLVEANDQRSLAGGLARALSASPRERAMLGAAGRAQLAQDRRFGMLGEEMLRVVDEIEAG